ncbi:MAG TPA: hypothetical protein VFU16_06125 [Solirubrobacterales bacterium]|nr:hypothetical protein [Solirubrobacterales bacterium]
MNLTKIATALVAILAMSAVVASGASANQLTSPGNNNVVLVTEDFGNHVFTVDGQSLTCKKTSGESGTIAVPANTITGLKTSASECSAFGFAGSIVNMGNCHTDFTTPTKLQTDEYTSQMMIICDQTSGSANNVITVNSSVFGSECSISIGQTGNEALNHVIIHNTTNNAPRDLTLTTKVTGIRVVKNKDNGLCPLSGTGTVNNGTLNGEATVREKAGKDISIE